VRAGAPNIWKVPKNHAGSRWVRAFGDVRTGSPAKHPGRRPRGPRTRCNPSSQKPMLHGTPGDVLLGCAFAPLLASPSRSRAMVAEYGNLWTKADQGKDRRHEEDAAEQAAAADGSGSLRGSRCSPLASPGRSSSPRWTGRIPTTQRLAGQFCMTSSSSSLAVGRLERSQDGPISRRSAPRLQAFEERTIVAPRASRPTPIG